MLFRFSKHWSILLTFKKINDGQTLPAKSVPGVRRAKAAISSGCKPHPATLKPEAIGAVMTVDEVAEAVD
jgi:hypothetical protein